MSSDRSASPARRWSGRAGRRREWRGWRIPGHDRSWCFLWSIRARRRRLATDDDGSTVVGSAPLRASASSLRRTFATTLGAVKAADGNRPDLKCVAVSRYGPDTILSQMRQDGSLLSFAARSAAAVVPPPTLVRFNDSRMPWVGIGARLALMVRELTPIQEISDDSRP